MPNNNVQKILANLRAFNSKERYFVVGMALGNPKFRLCSKFRTSVEKTFGLILPKNAFSAMDYHLDWVQASLILSQDPVELHQNSDKSIHATLEDIDFLIACQIEAQCHIIFLEAKGVTLFSNKQLQSKIKRLTRFFGDEGQNWPDVVPHFAIVSPKLPQKINRDNWPSWALPDGDVKWIEMKIEPRLQKVVRCNLSKIPDNKGEHWVARPRKY